MIKIDLLKSMTHMIQTYCVKYIISKRFFVMNIAVRYCSKTKFGNTRRIAEAIADGVGVKAGDASAFVENYSRM